MRHDAPSTWEDETLSDDDFERGRDSYIVQVSITYSFDLLE